MTKVYSARPLIVAALALALCATALLPGCTLAPAYHRPDAPIPSTYGNMASENGAEGSQNLPWKGFITDSVIRELVELALHNNRDLRIAMLNIERTRGMFRIQAADLLPTISAAGEADITRTPKDVSQTGQTYISRQYSASLGFSAFELDLFGRIRSLTEQALETYYSTEEEARSAQLALVAEVTAMYLQVVADRELVDVTAATYENRKKMFNLIEKRFESGVVSQLDVNQAKSSMEEARGNLAVYKTSLGQAENALALLLGSPIPANIPEIRTLAEVEPLPDVPEGLPSTLLERRPDIRAAEHMLKGANANIGAARANFFPTISLTGAFGTISDEYYNLFDGGTGFWSFMPQVSLPIFDTGRNIARLRVSEAERDIAVARYEKSIQSAFREVADALTQRLHIEEQLSSAKAFLDATTMSYKLSDARYTTGIDSFLSVLDAQRSQFAAEQNYISTRLLRETNALNLYKSLGGGWE